MNSRDISSSMNDGLRLIAVTGLLMLAACDGQKEAAAQGGTAKVLRGPLVVTVQEGGELQSANPTVVRSEIEGRATILELVSEGTAVKKGDRIGRLDAASIEDKLNRQEIQLEKARSNLLKSEQDVEVQKKKNAEADTAARTNHELAGNALKGYQEGKRPLLLAKLQSELTVAVEKLKRAEKQAAASRRLKDKSFISQTELEADELMEKQSREAVDIATRSLEQLQKWEAPDEVMKLEADVEVKAIALERVRQQAKSEMQQLEDALAASRKAHVLEKDARDKLSAQMSKAVITASSDGIVVYGRQERGRMGGSEPMGIGKEVHEQEEIVRIPDLSAMIVEVDVHETAVKKLQRGQRAHLKVDALPGRSFSAVVDRVALVASSQSSWFNPDLKVYETVLRVEGDVEGMKPGMHAEVVVGIGSIANALQIPLQAVREVGGRNWVYVLKSDGSPELREVKLGDHNETNVEVKQGLEENEEVFLHKPTGAPAPPPGDPEKPPVMPATEGGRGQPSGTGGQMGGAQRPMDDGNVGGMPAGGAGVTEEQKKAMRERMQNMTPEEREEMKKKMGGRGGRGGQPGGQGGAPAGGSGGGANPAGGRGDGKD